jgi:large subunit ribosomal protein L28
MAYICDICGKGKVVGRTQRHKRGVAGKRWRKRAQKTVKVFSPNLQKATFTVDGEDKQMKVCAKCLKRAKIEGKVKTYSKPAVV